MKKYLKIAAMFWTLFIGLGAVGGALAMFIDPTGVSTGMSGLLPGLKKLPFSEVLFDNLIFSGISLLIVNGITQLATFFLIIKKIPCAPKCVAACGVILMLWISIQFFIFDMNFLSNAYFIFGLLEAATGIWMVKAREH